MLVTKTSDLISLTDACREAHEALSESIRQQIEKRKASNIPLDDSTDFEFVEARAGLLVRACQAMDGRRAAELAKEIGQACGGGLQELGPFEPVEDYDGIKVRLRAVTERFRIEVGERIAECKSLAEQRDVLSEYVARAYEEVVGLEDENGPIAIKRDGDRLPAEAMETLDAAGLISDLWHVARRYAELPASKKKHFGSRQPSTSGTSDATAARPDVAGSSAATVAPMGATDSQSTSQTPAPAGTF